MAKAMRKVRTGSVVRTKQDKTAVVEMVWKQRHRLYHKQVRRVARFYVHDPENQCLLGDVVRIQETRADLQKQALAPVGDCDPARGRPGQAH